MARAAARTELRSAQDAPGAPSLVAQAGVPGPLPATRPEVERQPARQRSLSLGAIALRRLRRDKVTLIAGAVLLLYALLALGADVLASNVLNTTPTRINMLDRFAPPTLRHPLGTDDFGRDQFVRLLYGARVSLTIGFAAAAVNLSLGVLLGALAGFYGKRVDDVIVWLINTLRAVPTLFLLILVGALFRPGAEGLALVIGLTSWPGIARLMRGQVLAARGRDYVLAARALGATDRRQIFGHVLPNVLPIALVVLGQDIGSVILTESALSYLGVGVQPPNASWGNMLSNAQRFFNEGLWLVLAPGWFIFTTVLALYLVADGLRDALDPRQAR